MNMRRFAFPALLALMVMAFAVPSHANYLTGATGTISCSSYSLTFTYDNLIVGNTYTTAYSFTINSTSAPSSTTISDSYTFTASASTETQSVGPTAIGPFTGTISVTSALASGPSLNQTIMFTPSTSFDCGTVTPANGRFTGGGDKIITAGGISVSFSLELDCDRHHSYNLEINWSGHHFHLETFDAASCYLIGPPEPPFAPINEMIGVGTGLFDGMPGYTVSFTLIDNGEPGRSDEAAFLITGPGGGIVLNVPLQSLTKGNLQAHLDQQ